MEAVNNTESIHVTINQATRNVWEGDAVSVSSKNSEGPFDILPMHSNFISLIQKEPIVINDVKGEVHTFTFDQSVVYVRDNTVKIYADFTEYIG